MRVPPAPDPSPRPPSPVFPFPVGAQPPVFAFAPSVAPLLLARGPDPITIPPLHRPLCAPRALPSLQASPRFHAHTPLSVMRLARKVPSDPFVCGPPPTPRARAVSKLP